MSDFTTESETDFTRKNLPPLSDHAFWRMYGLGLSDEVLKKLYYKNALKIIPGLDKSGFPE